MRRAAEAWRGAAPGVWFDVVDDSAGALVHVVWRRTLAQRAPARPLVGRTTLALAAGTRPVAALVELALWADDARGYAPLDVERAAVHELGHVLGLAHVRDGTSIMADPPRAMRPSARDRLALRELRHGVPHAGSPPPPTGVLEPVAWRSDAPHPRLHR